MPTEQQCKSQIFKIAIKFGVSPALISTRLLSKEDKVDMLNGLVPDETLACAVECWVSAGMPDYANGLFKPYSAR